MEELISKMPEECGRYLPEIFSFFEAAPNGEMFTWKDHLFGATFPAKTVEYVHNNWRPRDGDVLVASHMKTGTSWVREMVRMILYGDNEELDRLTRAATTPLTYIEGGPVCSLRMMDCLPWKRRIFVSHLPSDILQIDEYLKKDIKVICPMRNPKDQAVSCYHFFNNLPYRRANGYKDVIAKDWNTWFENHIAGKIPTSCKVGEFYPSHILSWLPYKNHPKFLFLKYEDMKKNPLETVSKIATFIGKPLSDAQAAKIAQETTIDRMKQRLDEGNLAESEILKELGMYRKGQVGGWKEYFTEDQSKRMDEIFRKKLEGTGLTFDYE